MPDLLSVQGIDETDLAENRQGRLTDRQVQAFAARVARSQWLVYGAVGAGLFFGGIGALASGLRTGKLGAMAAGCLAAALFAGVALTIVKKLVFAPLMRVVEDKTVSTVEGTIDRLYVSFGARGYSAWIDGRRYGSSRTEVGRLLTRGDRVRAFVGSGTRVIVAIEKL